MRDLTPTPSTRGPNRIQCYCDEETARAAREAAAAEGVPVSAWLKQNVLSQLERRRAEEQDYSEARNLAKRKKLFLENVRQQYHLGAASRSAGIEPRTLARWLDDSELRDQIAFQRALFLEQVERKLLAIGRGDSEKGCWLALLAFLNANHPQYGVKAELLWRISADLMERFQASVRQVIGESQAAQVIQALQQHAEKKALQFR
jgi:hypothetical protein